MERDTFDCLVRFFGTAGSRRAALRLVAAAGLLGGVASLEGAAAKRRGRGRVRAQQSAVVPCPGPPACATARPRSSGRERT